MLTAVKVTFWGTRGSIAKAGPTTVRYGGNTSCVEVRPSDGRLVVIDAGTGLRNLGAALERPPGRPPERIDILLSHLHLDHIEGLGFFDPLWDERSEVHVWGPRPGAESLAQGLRAYFGPPIFPIPIHEVPANLTIHEAPAEPFELGPLRVTAARVEHPGPTLGYRLEDGERALVYISDHEPARTGDLRAPDPGISGHGLALDADLLIHDGQFTETEYAERVGWGHSSVPDAVAFAQLARARALLLFHHDPSHCDEDLDALGLQARELWGPGADRCVTVAAEGMELEVVSLRAAPVDPS